MKSTDRPSEKRWFFDSCLAYIVFERSKILFDSTEHTEETAKNHALGFAMQHHPDFHVALLLAPSEPDPFAHEMHSTSRIIKSVLDTKHYPVKYMKFTDFAHLFLRVVDPVLAMSERLKGRDPLLYRLRLPAAEYLKNFWIVYRIID